jgi:hypothetical protein
MLLRGEPGDARGLERLGFGVGFDVGRARELPHQRGHVGGAARGVLLEHAGHERIEPWIDVVAELADPWCFLEQDLGEDRDERVGHERGATHQALEDHAAQREHVGAGVELGVAARLLGRHVARGPDRHAYLGRIERGLGEAGHPEVEHLHPSQIAAREEEVGRLDVAVHDAAAVGLGERVGHLPRQAEHVVERQGPPLQALVQILALEPLHGEERAALGGEAVAEVAHDAGVVELGEDPRLALEPARVIERELPEQLDGRWAPALAVEAAIDGAHGPDAGDALDDESSCDDVAWAHAHHGIRAPAAASRAGAGGGAAARWGQRTTTTLPGEPSRAAAPCQPSGSSGPTHQNSQRASPTARLMQPWLRREPKPLCQKAPCRA